MENSQQAGVPRLDGSSLTDELRLLSAVLGSATVDCSCSATLADSSVMTGSWAVAMLAEVSMLH